MAGRARRDTGTDDPRVRVRPGKGSRPRTKQRPAHRDAVEGMVTRIDRGHYRIRLDDPGLTRDGSGDITAMKARELGRGKVVVGDRVAVVGDTSGRSGTLARMVRIQERSTLLRRSAEDGDAAGTQRPVVANAELLVIVTAVADPQPRPRMIDRYLVAAYDAGMEPLLILTKSDLADATPLSDLYKPLGVRCLSTVLAPHGPGPGPAERPVGPGPQGGGEPAVPVGAHRGLGAVREALTSRTSVLVGHSGVGKSTLINALVPGAGRATGQVNAVTGRGRHTSTSLQALELPGGGWVIDTPGVRSFGVAHVGSAEVLQGFADLAQVAQDCPRGCPHLAGALDCALEEWAEQAGDAALATHRRARLDSFRRLLAPALEAEDPTRP
ncbi:ribosome small subunit-dependent GTPase A [Actinomyces capricornis]|uniref:Small ribosomal subunit biogenesis GTPase RsgA n=1 Tax=Actinomyces capricornis TaxID=2755559 RepID=A0ABN6K4K2_9ACTO|nr:ribosome small subunit-dependent GTPase A [Actinomyces capricornis]BDA63597.1 putative ribosome biogenesis GTPase RsgA [Actinomyces capricornis]